ncbi:MAG: hypothetical protein RLZZ28_705 [Bacteroidota bacterium]
MFIFLCLYIASFITALYRLFHKYQEGIFIFFICGLPIYITSLSVANMYGLSNFIPFFQAFKEVIVLVALVAYTYRYNRKLRLQPIDWLLLLYVAYNFLYALLPLGPYSLMERLIALKGISFFPFIYFAGRFCDPRQINLNKWFQYLCLLAIVTGIVLLFEIIPYKHLQTYTGYADFNASFFNVDPAGNYGLTWTFESINGIKRFASFYSMPLEHAAATLVSISVIAALATDKQNRVRLNTFLLVSFLFTLLSIAFAFSRAAFASYFLMIYVYMLITNNRLWLKMIHLSILLVIIAVLVWLKGDIYEVITTTIDFSDSSSVSHLIEWVAGLQAIGSNPLGLGLGHSGRIAGSFGENIGGENQLIIIGVQTGIVSMLLYITIYASIVKNAFKLFRRSKINKERKIGLSLVLVKIGMIIPLLTAEAEAYLYISYLVWFLSGMLISIIASKAGDTKTMLTL